MLSGGGEPILTLGKNDHQVQATVFWKEVEAQRC